VRKASKQVAGTEIAAGVGAAGALLAMIFLLGMPLWLGIFLAALVYAGARLLAHQTSRELPEGATEAEMLRQIDQLCQAVPNPRVRSKIAAIRDQAGLLRAFLEQHPDKDEAWSGILRECLESTLRISRRYVELSRFFEDPTRQSVTQVEELLGQVSTTFANLRTRLVDEGAADLSAETEVFRSTLQALNEVNVLNRPGGRS
jgi:hypothetical protein